MQRSLRRYLVLALMLAALFTATFLNSIGYSIYAQEEDLTETYTGDGFSIQYPEGWTVDDEQLDGQVVFSSDEDTELDAFDSIEEGRIVFGIALPQSLAQIDLAPDADPAELMDVLQGLMYTQGEFRSVDTLVIGEGGGLRADGTNAEDAYVMVTALSYEGAGTIATVTIAAEETFAAYEPLILAMLESITFDVGIAPETVAPETTETPTSGTGETGTLLPLSEVYTTTGFSINYPEGWAVVGEEPGLVVEISSDADVELGTVEGLAPGQFGVGILLPGAVSEFGLGAEASARDMLALIAQGFLEVTLEEVAPEIMTVQDSPAFILRTDTRIVIAVDFDAGIVTLGAEAAVEDFELIEDYALQMLETIVFDASLTPPGMPSIDEIVVPRLADEYAYADPGFSIRVPGGWRVDDSALPSRFIVTSGDFDINSTSLAAGDVIFAIIFPGTFEADFDLPVGAAPVEYATIAREQLLSDESDVSEVQTETIAGYDAASFTTRSPAADVKFIFFQIDGEIFAYSLRTLSGYLEAYDDFHTRVIESLEWDIDLNAPEATAAPDETAAPDDDTPSSDTGGGQTGMPPPLTETYTAGGFSIDYPAGWAVVAEDEGVGFEISSNPNARIGSPDTIRDGDYALGFILPAGIENMPFNEKTPQTVMDFLIEAFLSVDPEGLEPITDIVTEEITVQGAPALISRSNRSIVITVGFDFGVLAMGGQTTPDFIEQLEIIMLQILDTATFDPDAVSEDPSSGPDMLPTLATMPTLVPTPTSGDGGDSSAIPVPVPDAVYTYDELNFSMNYPSEWIVGERRLPYQLEFTSGDFDFNSEDLASGQVALGVAFPRVFEEELEISADDTLQDIGEMIRELSVRSGSIITELETIDIDGNEAVLFREQLEAVESMLVIFRLNDQNYAVALRTARGDLDAYQPFIDEVIASMVVDGDARPPEPAATEEASGGSRLSLRDDKTQNDVTAVSNRRLRLPRERE